MLDFITLTTFAYEKANQSFTGVINVYCCVKFKAAKTVKHYLHVLRRKYYSIASEILLLVDVLPD